MKKLSLIFILVIASIFSFSQGEWNLKTQGANTGGAADVSTVFATGTAAGYTVFHLEAGIYRIRNNVVLPAYSLLIIDKGAVINATDTLQGNHTSIQAGNYQIFDRASILTGTWDVNEFPVDWFGMTSANLANNLSNEFKAACDFATLTTGKAVDVRNHYDLVKAYTIPDGIELKFLPGGIIDATGTITGDSTSIVADPGQQIFSTTTTVAGTWKAPIATSAWVGNNAGKYTALTARLDSSLVTSIKINAASSNVVGISSTYSPIASPTFTGTASVPTIKLTTTDTTGTPVKGAIVFRVADSSFYGCRSVGVGKKKWYKLNP